jgi:hypothetical protein
MSYTMMAESKAPLEWPSVLAALKPLRKRVELFPIPGEGGKPDGLGLSVPQRQRDDLGMEELTQILDVLRSKFGMSVLDPQTGEPVPPEGMAQLQSRFVVE